MRLRSELDGDGWLADRSFPPMPPLKRGGGLKALDSLMGRIYQLVLE